MDEAKAKLVLGRITRAGHELASARKLASVPSPYLDTAIYHCQQTGETAVEALLLLHDQRFKRTHDVAKLIELAAIFSPNLSALGHEATILNPYISLYRPPGPKSEPDQAEFDLALAAARKIYDAVLSLLPAPVHP